MLKFCQSVLLQRVPDHQPPSSLWESFCTHGTSSAWPRYTRMIRSEYHGHTAQLQKPLDCKDTGPACAIQARFLPAQEHSADTPAESKPKSVHSTGHSYPRNAPLPQPHKGLKQLNLLFVTEGFIFSCCKCQQKVAPTYQSR